MNYCCHYCSYSHDMVKETVVVEAYAVDTEQSYSGVAVVSESGNQWLLTFLRLVVEGDESAENVP